jgi:hypothetical protein
MERIAPLHRAALDVQRKTVQWHSRHEAQNFEVVLGLEEVLPRRASFGDLWLTLLLLLLVDTEDWVYYSHG